MAGWARRRARTGALHCAAHAGARRDVGALPSITGAITGARRDAGALPSITGAVDGARRDAGALPSITGAVAGARRDAGALPAARAPIMLGTYEMPGSMQGAFGWCGRRAAQASWAGFPWPVLAPAGCLALDHFTSLPAHRSIRTLVAAMASEKSALATMRNAAWRPWHGRVYAAQRTLEVIGLTCEICFA